MSRRTEQLIAAVDKFNAMHDAWAADEHRPNPDEIYWDAFDELVATFTTGDIPGDCVKLLSAVNELVEEDQIFEEREDTQNAYPHDGFWEAREALAKLREQPKIDDFIPLEPILTLHQQKVSHRQIALMYGLLLPNGEPAAHLIQNELDKPGSVIGPNWVDPRKKEHEQRQRAQAGDLQALLRRKSQRAAEASKPCPESPRELWEQKVPVAQAAAMLKIPIAEVQGMFDQFEAERKAATDRPAGGPLPSDGPAEPEASDGEVHSASAVGGDDDSDDTDEFDEEDDADGEEETNVDQAIIELYREGNSVDSIKQELGIDGRKVAAVIRAYQGRQETAEATA